MPKKTSSLSFVVLILFFLSYEAWAKDCDSVHRMKPPTWVSAGGVVVRNLPLTQLLQSGVAHLAIPDSILRQLVSTRYSFDHPIQGLSPIYDDARLDVIDRIHNAVTEYLLTELEKALPDYEIEEHMTSAFGGGGANLVHEGWHWHRDHYGHSNPQPIETIAEGQLRSFMIRANFPIPIDLLAPTVVKPAGGEFIGRPLHGVFNQFTIFITDVVEHSVPLRETTSEYFGRTVFFFDFVAKKK
ncbi:MAG: hypothetical protein C5B49_14530 [Bdellovibrio sp.]|nr:MAG: hypothetical protein C5B49_14530 [Bdellovibrio sp.]